MGCFYVDLFKKSCIPKSKKQIFILFYVLFCCVHGRCECTALKGPESVKSCSSFEYRLSTTYEIVNIYLKKFVS